jgi:hypothetical protein
VKIPPVIEEPETLLKLFKYETAINLAPSADEATDHQYSLGTLLGTQVAPEFVEVKIIVDGYCGVESPPGTATNFVPSADEATETHTFWGAAVSTQVVPAFVET